MKVLVTGGAGFIGSHTVDGLLERGYDVRILDGLLAPVHADNKLPDYIPSGVEVVQGDVRDRASWEQALDGVEAVFHLAAYQDYLPDFSTFFHTNTVATALLYEVIVAKSLPIKKVVVASSQSVYGEAKYLCTSPHSDGSPVYPPLRDEGQLKRSEWEIMCPSCGEPLVPQWTDEAVVTPHNQYSISKYTQELVSLNIGKRYGIPTACMRYSIVQGARQSFRNAYSGVLRIFAQRLLHGLAPICYEDGQQLRDYVSVHDVARANIAALESEDANWKSWNVGGDRQVTVVDFGRLMAQRAGVDIEPEVPGVYRFGDTRHVFSDVAGLGTIGWKPEVSLEQIMDEYLAWVRVQPDFRDYTTEASARMEELGSIRKSE